MGDGAPLKRSGAAECMARAAQDKETDAPPSVPPALPMIATQALPIGWPDGAPQKRIGVAGTLARAAHQQQEVVHERHFADGWVVARTLALVPSSGAWLPLVLLLVKMADGKSVSHCCAGANAPSSG